MAQETKERQQAFALQTGVYTTMTGRNIVSKRIKCSFFRAGTIQAGVAARQQRETERARCVRAWERVYLRYREVTSVLQIAHTSFGIRLIQTFDLSSVPILRDFVS